MSLHPADMKSAYFCGLDTL